MTGSLYKVIDWIYSSMNICKSSYILLTDSVTKGPNTERVHYRKSINATINHARRTYVMAAMVAEMRKFNPFIKSVKCVDTLFIDKLMINKRQLKGVYKVIDKTLHDINATKSVDSLINICVNGYDDDPKPLWEIEEVRRLFAELHNCYPYLIFLMDPCFIQIYILSLIKCKTDIKNGFVSYDEGELKALIYNKCLQSYMVFMGSIFNDMEVLRKYAEESKIRAGLAFQFINS